MSEKTPSVINDSIMKTFVPVMVGIERYRAGGDTDVMRILARLKAESELMPEKWNLFGYERRPKRDYYRSNLLGDVDVVFIPQTRDEKSWREKCLSCPGRVFDYTEPVGEPCPETWYLSTEEKGHWFKEVPRFFQIWADRGTDYWGLVIRELRLFESGEWGLDPSACYHFTTGKTFVRHHGKCILETQNRKESAKPSLIPVIARAKLVSPYTVRLVHPDDRGRL